MMQLFNAQLTMMELFNAQLIPHHTIWKVSLLRQLLIYNCNPASKAEIKK